MDILKYMFNLSMCWYLKRSFRVIFPEAENVRFKSMSESFPKTLLFGSVEYVCKLSWKIVETLLKASGRFQFQQDFWNLSERICGIFPDTSNVRFKSMSESFPITLLFGSVEYVCKLSWKIVKTLLKASGRFQFQQDFWNLSERICGIFPDTSNVRCKLMSERFPATLLFPSVEDVCKLSWKIVKTLMKASGRFQFLSSNLLKY
ncbi:hypothetical protein TSAR_006199 [Trichomalopsis sarcophagae]|uniref:Uncharacterized protein n=1 Tax=Trichomalopsis sarcophagae TaxID=543379 RepID=A0A232FBI4_9HYME|nr:hypothetical protein TSAR_006199 [Trichomalopsis sarcophagae]